MQLGALVGVFQVMPFPSAPRSLIEAVHLVLSTHSLFVLFCL